MNQTFQEEINFFTHQKVLEVKRKKHYRETMKSVEPTEMFKDLQELVESSDDEKSENMPVRKFYNNTFNTLLNRAIFALTKKQSQYPNERDYFTTQGMIKFVAQELLTNPPDAEAEEAYQFEEEDTV